MMIAALYEQFKAPVRVVTVPDPVIGPGDVLITVKSTGICRSDWHGWQGHDSDIHLPHVPGHELAGIIEEAGKEVKHFSKGDRVTVPFCGGCGYCNQCLRGQEQICDNYFQPGFTGWGSFAELVRIRYADHNLVKIPDALSFQEAAALGCRFITAWRGLVSQGAIKNGDWVSVYGCGGVGLSAVMIAHAFGARVIAIDIAEGRLRTARSIGADLVINATAHTDVPEFIQEVTKGGVDVSLDALGSRQTCSQSILSLKKQGKHIQLGLLAGKESNPPLPMSAVISRELQIIGSHGMAAHQYGPMLKMITEGKLPVSAMISREYSLEEGIAYLSHMDLRQDDGIALINPALLSSAH